MAVTMARIEPETMNAMTTGSLRCIMPRPSLPLLVPLPWAMLLLVLLAVLPPAALPSPPPSSLVSVWLIGTKMLAPSNDSPPSRELWPAAEEGRGEAESAEPLLGSAWLTAAAGGGDAACTPPFLTAGAEISRTATPMQPGESRLLAQGLLRMALARAGVANAEARMAAVLLAPCSLAKPTAKLRRTLEAWRVSVTARRSTLATFATSRSSSI